MEQAKIPWLVTLMAIFVFTFTNLFSLFIFNHVPHINDEIAYLFQAKIFNTKHLFVSSPCAKEFFNFTHVINNGKWYSQYPPGHPLLLLLGLWLGVPWIINPIFASLSIILFYLLGEEIYTQQIGVLAAFFGMLSIWFLVISSTMMSHTTCMFFISLFLLFFFRSLKNPSAVNGLITGLSLGMAFLIRPYSALWISLPFLIIILIKSAKNLRKSIKSLLVLGGVLVLFILIILIYNKQTNGHPLLMGYTVCHGESDGIGFAKTGYTQTPHTPYLGLVNTWKYLKELNKYLFGWPLSSFFAFIPLFFFGYLNKKFRRKDLVLASGFFSLLFGHFFYWGTYILIGPRMIFESLPILLLLSARGLNKIFQVKLKLNSKFAFKVRTTAIITLSIFTIYAFSYRLPNWIWPKNTEWYYSGFANKFARVNPDIHKTLNEVCPKNSLVVFKFLYHPIEYFPAGWYGSGFLNNDPYLKADVIYALSISKDLSPLFDCYPNRTLFLYYGTLEKGILIPLKKDSEKILYEKPVNWQNQKNNSVKIISNPLDFYTIYSIYFRDFLIKLYKQNDDFKIDVPYLLEKGNQYLNMHKYKEASYCYEAALQLEKEPTIRFVYLNKLNQCYLKSGQCQEAKEILKRLKNSKQEDLYQIIPERGF